MKLHSTKSSSAFRSSNRGSLLLDVGVAMIGVTLMLVVALPVAQHHRQTLLVGGSLPKMNGLLEREVATFSAASSGTVPDVTPNSAGTTDAGEHLQAIRSTSFDATLGMRKFAVAVFVPGSQRAVVGGSVRLEPVAATGWRPDGNNLPTATTQHVLTVSPGTTSRGTVGGSGTYAFGTVVTITAAAFPKYHFTGWTGTARIASPGSATTTVVIDEDRTVTATFAP